MTNEEVIIQFELEAPDDFTIYSFVKGKMLNKAEVIQEMKDDSPHNPDSCAFVDIFKLGFEGGTKLYKAKS